MRPAALLFLASACAPRPAAIASPANGPPAFESWANGAVFYEVFVRSFADSNGDGKGDLAGLVARLDYLNDGDPATDGDLGVDALWLMPVFVSPSYHGYDTTDYENINPDYGTNADFARLCVEAHRRGMRVIVDLVLNHTSSKHPWFIDSASSPASPRRDWYVWAPSDPGWAQPWNANGRSWHPLNGAYYYGLFSERMPDLNLRSAEVRAQARRVAALWLGRGVDGFRLDATRHLIETGPGAGQSDTGETHAFLREFSAFVRQTQPQAVLVGENWTETPTLARYYGDTRRAPGGDELPLSFSFPLAAEIVAAAQTGKAGALADAIAEMQERFPPGATWVPFLTNHDMQRVATKLGDDPAKLRSAVAVLLTLPGTPFIYYGEEIGLANGPGREDEWKRTPMPWDGSAGHGFTTGTPWMPFAPGAETTTVAAETNDPGSLLSFYRRLIRVRHASRALRRGRLELVTRTGPVLAYFMTDGDERLLVAHNLGDEATTVPVGAASATALLAPAGAEITAERVALPPHGSGVWRLR